MRRISYWILSTVSAVVLLVGFDASRHTPSPSVTPFSSSATSSGPSSTTGGAAPKKSTHTNATHAKVTRTVTGSVAQTQWGPVQVQLVVSSGSITRVNVVQYPDGNPHDAEINHYALPILVKETTDHQSAQIDMVSGATVTSTGYLQSLQSALDQAHL